MKTEETLTSDSQPVTWGNRVATILMIMVVWLVPLLLSALDGLSWVRAIASMTDGLSTIPCTFGLLLALGTQDKGAQKWFKFFAFAIVFIPVSFVVNQYYPPYQTSFDKLLSDMPKIQYFISRYIFSRDPYLDTMPINSNYWRNVGMSSFLILLSCFVYSIRNFRRANRHGK